MINQKAAEFVAAEVDMFVFLEILFKHLKYKLI